MEDRANKDPKVTSDQPVEEDGLERKKYSEERKAIGEAEGEAS